MSDSITSMPATLPSVTRLNAERALSALKTQAAARGRADPATNSDALTAARQFEALLVHNMLKAMRATSFAEDTSNEQSMYFDMFDEKIAAIVTEQGGLGFAERIAGQLQSRHDTAQQSTPPATPAAGSELAAADLQRLRALVPDSSPSGLKQTPTTADPPEGTLPVTSGSTTLTDASWQWASSLWIGGPPAQDGGKDLQTVQRTFINEMKSFAERSARRLGTSSLPVLAVAAHESGWGRSLAGGTAQPSHNLFGIKATHAHEPQVEQRTTEYINGERQTVAARFRRYNSAAEAMDDFASFLQQNPRYARALQQAGKPEQFIRELHSAGYATDPRYADKVIQVMHQIAALAPELTGASAS